MKIQLLIILLLCLTGFTTLAQEQDSIPDYTDQERIELSEKIGLIIQEEKEFLDMKEAFHVIGVKYWLQPPSGNDDGLMFNNGEGWMVLFNHNSKIYDQFKSESLWKFNDQLTKDEKDVKYIDQQVNYHVEDMLAAADKSIKRYKAREHKTNDDVGYPTEEGFKGWQEYGRKKVVELTNYKKVMNHLNKAYKREKTAMTQRLASLRKKMDESIENHNAKN